MAKRWYERHPQRLWAEQAIMKGSFPQFVLREADGRLFWEGILVTNFGTHYKARIIYGRNHPYEKPSLRVVRPEIRNDSPHRFADGTLCIYPDRYDYKRWTAPASVPLLASWLALYEVWVRTGKWS